MEKVSFMATADAETQQAISSVWLLAEGKTDRPALVLRAVAALTEDPQTSGR
jgi:hypothetical protein